MRSAGGQGSFSPLPLSSLSFILFVCMCVYVHFTLSSYTLSLYYITPSPPTYIFSLTHPLTHSPTCTPTHTHTHTHPLTHSHTQTHTHTGVSSLREYALSSFGVALTHAETRTLKDKLIYEVYPELSQYLFEDKRFMQACECVCVYVCVCVCVCV